MTLRQILPGSEFRTAAGPTAKPSIVRICPADILTIDGKIRKTFHILIPRWHLTDAMNAKANGGGKCVATHATVAASGRTDDVARGPAFPPTDENQIIYVNQSAKGKRSRAARVRHPLEDPACDRPGTLSV